MGEVEILGVLPALGRHLVPAAGAAADEQAFAVHAADIDGDKDIDVLSASLGDNKIAWYENTDGLGTFSTETVITLAANGATSVYAADFDGDNDNDVVSASDSDD